MRSVYCGIVCISSILQGRDYFYKPVYMPLDNRAVLIITSLLPLATLGSHISLAVVLTALIGRTTFRSYLALPPPKAIRDHECARRSHVKLFSVLAVISLLFANYWGYTFISLSYRVWAAERGIKLPERLAGRARDCYLILTTLTAYSVKMASSVAANIQADYVSTGG
jgi:hypothetical protein